jgi:hypothetical protein
VRGVPAVHGEQRRERAEQDLWRMTSVSPAETRKGRFAYHQTMRMRSLFCNDQDAIDERLRVRVLAGADGAWLGIGAGSAQNSSSSASSLTSPDVSVTVRASCAPSAPVRLGRRTPRAEHGDLVHGAFASRHAGGGRGDWDVRDGFCGTWRRRAFSGSSSATRLVCEAWSAGGRR